MNTIKTHSVAILGSRDQSQESYEFNLMTEQKSAGYGSTLELRAGGESSIQGNTIDERLQLVNQY